MEKRALRRRLFREFLKCGKKGPALKEAHRIVWQMEELGLTEAEVRRKFKMKGGSYSRQLVRLYQSRKERLIYQIQNNLPEFGGIMILEKT